MKRFFTFLTLFVSLSLAAVFAGDITVEKKPGESFPARQAFMERMPGQFDAAEYAEQQQETFDWLVSEAAGMSPASIISIRVSEAELAEVSEYRCETCGQNKKLRVGISKSVHVPVSFNQLNLDGLARVSGFQSNGMMQVTPDGGFVWTAAAESPGATALRLHLTGVNLPENAELYIYNMDGQAFGPYTGVGPNGDGEFWTNTVSGPVAYLQLRHFGPVTESALQSTRFVIEDVGHMGAKFLLPFLQEPDNNREALSLAMAFCSFNASCVVDASCYNVSAVSTAKDAVAHMLFVSGGWYYICSGGLVADTDTGTQIPYFLTANHCISRSSEASSLECYFFFKTSNCNGACYDPIGVVPRTLGSTILSTSSKESDYCFLQLSQNAPAGAAFLGWNSTPVANSNGTLLYRISHPQGAPQAYSKHSVDTQKGTCRSWPRGKWIYSTDLEGATEGGSSGSPVVNGSGQIVGQLSGACGYNVNDVCDTASNATVDGAFANYFTRVSQWLDVGGGPGGSTMHVASIVPSKKSKGPKTDAIAAVTIVDENNNPVSGANVTGTFTGDVSGTVSGTTDANGLVSLKITKTGSINNFNFCVTNVTHSSMTYDSGANVETCDGI
jgi:lysyl endopeptidase